MKCRYFFTSRAEGDLAKTESVTQYLIQNSIPHDSIITMEQIHDTQIGVVEKNERILYLQKKDGAVVTGDTVQTSIVMVVRTADCIPVCCIDKKNNVYGVAHIGWKGASKRFASKLLNTMVQHGAKLEDIQVIVGPHICSSCYTIPEERAVEFIQRGFARAVTQEQKQYHLNLQNVIYDDMKSVAQHEKPFFNVSNVLCTSCNADRYFSYRHCVVRKKQLEGHNVGILALSRYN